MLPINYCVTIEIVTMKGDPTTKHTDEAVKWRLFDKTVRQVRKAFIDVPTRELNATIDEAIANVREEKRHGFETGLT